MTGFLISSLSADLIRPGNGETINYTHVVFEWEQEPDAHSYNIQVSTTPSFDQVLFTDSSATPLILNKDQIDWDGTYTGAFDPCPSMAVLAPGATRTLLTHHHRNFRMQT